jgi:signal transduction histidine kinase
MSGASAGGGAQVEVRPSVDRLIRIMQRMPHGELIEWRNELPSRARILMDPDDFGEIVGNLLDNARKYARSIVRISSRSEAGRRRIYFEDDGSGISTRERQTLVQRGERATGEGEGFGLGLSIVTEALKQYGLALAIERSPLGGCAMSFVAPGWVEPEALADRTDGLE